MLQNQFGQATDNNGMFCFLNIFFLFCVCIAVTQLKKHMQEERDFFTSAPILFKSKNFVFYLEVGVCAERDVTQEVSREQT